MGVPSQQSSNGMHTIHQRRQALQQRLFSANCNDVNVRVARIAMGVEGCTLAMLLLDGGVAGAEPNLPRGWDAGLMDDDDGG